MQKLCLNKLCLEENVSLTFLWIKKKVVSWQRELLNDKPNSDGIIHMHLICSKVLIVFSNLANWCHERLTITQLIIEKASHKRLLYLLASSFMYFFPPICQIVLLCWSHYSMFYIEPRICPIEHTVSTRLVIQALEWWEHKSYWRLQEEPLFLLLHESPSNSPFQINKINVRLSQRFKMVKTERSIIYYKYFLKIRNVASHRVTVC